MGLCITSPMWIYLLRIAFFIPSVKHSSSLLGVTCSVPSCYLQVPNARDDAEWRSNRLSHHDFIAQQLRRGKRISPLFLIPGVTTRTVRRDWLHICDQGITADALGNAFKLFVSKMDARTQDERVKLLYARILHWYASNPTVQDKLIGLKWGGIQQQKSPPKLRGSAATVRSLVPFAFQTATDLLDPTDALEGTVIHLLASLNNCYKCLKPEDFNHDVLKSCSSKVAMHWEALHLMHGGRSEWKPKPKLHHFLELAEEGSQPNLCWTYRDEDYGGSIAQLARMRGRWRSVWTYSLKVLDLFRIGNPVPRVT